MRSIWWTLMGMSYVMDKLHGWEMSQALKRMWLLLGLSLDWLK